MERYCDLHTHSVFSDGTCSPREIVNFAEEMGLCAVALCDHNTVDGVPDFLTAVAGKNIEAIAGAEFSVDYQGTELHLLGLFIPPVYFAQISELMTDYTRRKEESNLSLVSALQAAGYSVDYQTIKEKSPQGTINRAHIAAELTEKGYTSSIQEAFATLLSKKGSYYKEPARPSVWDMIDFVRSINAVPVLAHPFLNLSEERLAEFLPEAKAKGLVGMECLYSKYDAQKVKRSIELADTFDLMYSGGSDFHGINKPDIRLGVGRGNLRVPMAWAENLKKTASR